MNEENADAAAGEGFAVGDGGNCSAQRCQSPGRLTWRPIDALDRFGRGYGGHRHSRSYAVTASVDHIDFLVPVRVGDLVILRSSVNRVFHTSMEVGVKVFVENYIADTSQHVASAYLTFVAVDGSGRRLRSRR